MVDFGKEKAFCGFLQTACAKIEKLKNFNTFKGFQLLTVSGKQDIAMAKQNGKYDWNCVQFTSVDKKTLKDDCTIRKGDETNRGKSGPLHCAIKIVTLVQTKFIIVILKNWIYFTFSSPFT